MPWVTKTKLVDETRTRAVDAGFSFNPSFRSRFIYFKFSGLRPNDDHWLFLEGRDVTTFANTSFDIDDFNSSSRSSIYRNPGDKYINETQFPSELGGPTGSPLVSTATGELEGIFFLQSNSTYNWKCSNGTSGYSFNSGGNSIKLLAINVSNASKKAALSYGTAEYASIGQFINYYMEDYTVQVQQEYKEWQAPPPPAVNYSNKDDGGSYYISGNTVKHVMPGSGGKGNTFKSFHAAFTVSKATSEAQRDQLTAHFGTKDDG